MSDPCLSVAYALMYVRDRGKSVHANLPTRHEALDVYLRCAAACSASFQAQQAKLVVVTNAVNRLCDRAARLGIGEGLDLREHVFSLQVPQDLRFYEAHYKLDLFDAFGRGDFGVHPTLVDLDTVLLRPLRLPKGLGLYDIHEQVVSAYGEAKVRDDLERLSGAPIGDIHWYGGEFISGSSHVFRELSASIKRVWPKYLDVNKSLHHIGDEMLLNAALPMLVRSGLRIDDFGNSGDIARWWSARTLSKQRALMQVKSAALLHLPADKPFLAGWAEGSDPWQNFFSHYRAYARRRITMRHAANLLDLVRGRQRLFVPSI